LVGHMPVVRHRFIRRRDLNSVPALLEEAVHRPLRVKYGPVYADVVQNPFSDLLAGRFAFTLTELMEFAENRCEAVWEIEACIGAGSGPMLLRVFLSHALTLQYSIVV